MPVFSVDIQHTEEFTYQVEAYDEDHACAIAQRMYAAEEPAAHEEIVKIGAVTNCEEISK